MHTNYQDLRDLRHRIAGTRLAQFETVARSLTTFLKAVFPPTQRGHDRWGAITVLNRGALLAQVEGYSAELKSDRTTKEAAEEMLPKLHTTLNEVLVQEPSFFVKVDQFIHSTSEKTLRQAPASTYTAGVSAALVNLNRTLTMISEATDSVAQAVIDTYLDELEGSIKKGPTHFNASNISSIARRIGAIQERSGKTLAEYASIGHRTAKMHGTTPSRWAAARAGRF